MTTAAEQTALPADVLAAVRTGGTLVLITGAGCSFEPPTDIPLGSTLASDAHDLLVAENVLKEGDCPRKDDLSQVAAAVFGATGSQIELVNRLPFRKMRAPTPNAGHLTTAALLRERAIASVVTLNFDVALTGAIQDLGGGEEVSIVTGADDHSHLADPSLIYLHGTAYAAADNWVLRPELLNQWDEKRWETVIARRVLTAPVIVFVGLGSPAAVLTESLRRIRETVPNGVKVFQVDTTPVDRSAFAETLRLEDGRYIQMGWCAFMKELSAWLAAVQTGELRGKADALTNREGWDGEDLEVLSASLGAQGLVGLGRLRAAWLLDSSPYLPRNEAHTELVADLALALMLVARRTGTTWRPRAAGLIEFRDGDRVAGTLAFASGRQSHRWHSLEAAVAQYADRWRDDNPTAVIVSGYVGSDNPTSTPPHSILEDENPDSIIARPRYPRLVSADALRAEPARIQEMVFL